MFEQTFKNIDDTLWKDAGCSSELDYVEQTSWVLFLKYLDDLEKINKPPPSFPVKPTRQLLTRNSSGMCGPRPKVAMANSIITKR